MKLKQITIIHILFWIYTIALTFSNFLIYPNVIKDPFYVRNYFVNMVLDLAVFYAAYYIIPFFFVIRNKKMLIPLTIVTIITIILVRIPTEYFIWEYILNIPGHTFSVSQPFIWFTLKSTIIYTLYALFIRLTINWIESERIKNDLIKQQQSSELALLRSQINPHFLFNTLNNIYSLVYSKSQEAPSAIMRLSSIMRYMLYDSNAEKVPLSKEIEYITSFIDLQKLRTHQENFVIFNINGSIQNRNIEPMLLIPFVENAFKHGSKKASPAITLSLNILPSQIFFSVTNPMREENTVWDNPSNGNHGGFGLENIKRRLNLLYPNKHTLTISKENNLYQVELLLETI